MKAHARSAAGLLISAIAVVAVAWWASRQEAPKLPSEPSKLALIAAAMAIYAVATVVRGWRWHVILRLDKVEHKPVDALALVCVGYMGNAVLPARGGEVLRVVLLAQRTTARRRQILGSIIAERVLDAGVLVLLFVGLTAIGVAGSPVGWVPAAAAATALAVAAVGLWAYMRLRRGGRFDRFAGAIRPVARAGRPLIGSAGAVLALATAFVWVLEAAIFVLVARSLGVELSILEGIFLNVLASFFALVPAAPGYVGTFDAALIFGLDALDVTGGVAFTAALLVRFVLFVPITATGLILLITRYGGLSGLRRSREEAAEPDELDAGDGPVADDRVAVQ